MEPHAPPDILAAVLAALRRAPRTERFLARTPLSDLSPWLAPRAGRLPRAVITFVGEKPDPILEAAVLDVATSEQLRLGGISRPRTESLPLWLDRSRNGASVVVIDEAGRVENFLGNPLERASLVEWLCLQLNTRPSANKANEPRSPSPADLLARGPVVRNYQLYPCDYVIMWRKSFQLYLFCAVLQTSPCPGCAHGSFWRVDERCCLA